MTTVRTLNADQVEALCQEAAMAGDYDLVKDCQRAAQWLASGPAWVGTPCRAALRVVRAIRNQEAQS